MIHSPIWVIDKVSILSMYGIAYRDINIRGGVDQAGMKINI